MKTLPLLAIVLFACSTGAPGSDAGSAMAVQQQRWETGGLKDYRFDFQQQCFCVREQVQPVTIEVRTGRISRVLSRETGEDITALQGLRWYTVPELFGLIAEAQRAGSTPLDVRYDPQLGYPAHIEIGSLAADAGVIYTATNLQPLPR